MIKSLLFQSTPHNLSQIGLGLLTVSAIAIASPAQAANLGAANDYNVFILGDITQSNTDTQGRIAVGGNTTYTNFSVCSSPSVCPQSAPFQEALKVGGNVSLTSATVNGDLTAGGQVTLTNSDVKGKATSGGAVVVNSGAGPVGGSFQNTPGLQASLQTFFGDASNYLRGLSTSLKQTTINLSKDGSGAITINSLASGLNIFNIQGSDFGSASSFNILGAPSDATVVINLLGNDFSVGGYGYQYNGFAKNNVLFNAPDATSLTLSALSLQGSLLAPNALVNGNNGNIEGTLVADGLRGNLEAHDFRFQGNVPDPGTPVPTPALLPGLIGFGASIWRRKRQTILNEAA